MIIEHNKDMIDNILITIKEYFLPNNRSFSPKKMLGEK